MVRASSSLAKSGGRPDWATGTRPDYEMPLPPFYDPARVREVDWYVPYEEREEQAYEMRQRYDVTLAGSDTFTTCVVDIDNQRTFCDPRGQLYVGGRSGTGAVDDCQHGAEWLYTNARGITRKKPSMDTHKRAMAFHAATWVGPDGKHPRGKIILLDDIESGRWRVNPKVAYSIGGRNSLPYLEAYFHHYVKTLTEQGKYPLMIWPYHAILGGNEHAFMPGVHEANWYLNCLRESEVDPDTKGGNALFEMYSITGGEVKFDHLGKAIKGARNEKFLKLLYEFDMLIIYGQAASHCVAWTIDGILMDFVEHGAADLAKKCYIVSDLCSPVVVPALNLDFTQMAEDAFARFARAGMNVVSYKVPVNRWGGVAERFGAAAA